MISTKLTLAFNLNSRHCCLLFSLGTVFWEKRDWSNSRGFSSDDRCGVRCWSSLRCMVLRGLSFAPLCLLWFCRDCVDGIGDRVRRSFSQNPCSLSSVSFGVGLNSIPFNFCLTTRRRRTIDCATEFAVAYGSSLNEVYLNTQTSRCLIQACQR